MEKYINSNANTSCKYGDFDTILDFYGDNYEKSYITGCIDGFVYYASDKTVWEISKIDTDIEN